MLSWVYNSASKGKRNLDDQSLSWTGRETNCKRKPHQQQRLVDILKASTQVELSCGLYKVATFVFEAVQLSVHHFHLSHYDVATQ